MNAEHCSLDTRRFPIGLGIRQVQVDDAARTIDVVLTERLQADALTPEHVSVAGGTRVPTVGVRGVVPVDLEADGRTRQFRLSLDRLGDYSAYTVTLRRGVDDSSVPDIDPLWASAPFRFHQSCADAGDCAPQTPQQAPTAQPSPLLDRQGKDFAAFKRFMEERLAARVDGWRDRSPADHAEMLVELVSHVADELSYAQDRVLQEAFLPTARHRWSITRHARLLDYEPSEGCSARTILTLSWAGGQPTWLEPGVAVSTADFDEVAEPIVFETEAGIELDASLNVLHPARDLLFAGDFDAASGKLMIDGAAEFDTPRWVVLDDDFHRVAVRVEACQTRTLSLREEGKADPQPRDVTELRWQTLWPERVLLDPARMRVYANAVMATHGQTVAFGGATDAGPAQGGRVGPVSARPLARPVGLDGAPGAASIELDVGGVDFERVDRLVESGPFDRHYEVITGSSGEVTVAFGDGEYGAAVAEGAQVRGLLRAGVGSRGNVGRHALTAFVAPPAGVDPTLLAVDNRLAARGGRDPQGRDEVLRGVQAHLRTRHRAVTLDDYEEAAAEVDGVRQAAATSRWTGSWETIFVYVLPQGGFEASDALVAQVRDHLEQQRMAAQPVCVAVPRISPIQVALEICLEPSARPAAVRAALLDALFEAPAAPLGLGRLVMGGEVAWSKIVAACEATAGVRWARLQTLGRLYDGTGGVRVDDCGVLAAAPLEVLRVEAHPADRTQGVLRLDFRRADQPGVTANGYKDCTDEGVQ